MEKTMFCRRLRAVEHSPRETNATRAGRAAFAAPNRTGRINAGEPYGGVKDGRAAGQSRPVCPAAARKADGVSGFRPPEIG